MQTLSTCKSSRPLSPRFVLLARPGSDPIFNIVVIVLRSSIVLRIKSNLLDIPRFRSELRVETLLIEDWSIIDLVSLAVVGSVPIPGPGPDPDNDINNLADDDYCG